MCTVHAANWSSLSSMLSSRPLGMDCLFVRPVRTHGTIRLQQDGFSWNFIFEYFSKNCPKISCFIEIRQEWWIRYMKINIKCMITYRLFLLRLRNNTHTICRENQNTYFIANTFFFLGARGGAVGWGTALQAGRSRVRFPMVTLDFFHWHNPCGRTMALGLTQPLTETSTRNISWGVKAAGAYGWQPYHLHVSTLLKSGSLNLLEPSGPVQACNGIALPLPYLFISKIMR